MIGATSAGPGQGSTFYVVLPIYRQRAESNVSCVLSAVGMSDVGGGGAPLEMLSNMRQSSSRRDDLLQGED